MSSLPPSSYTYSSNSKHTVPRPLQLLDVANLGNGDGASSSASSSSSKRASFTGLPSVPLSAPLATPQRSSSTRRQGSITYFSPQTESQRERAWKRRSAASSRSASATRGNLESPFVEKGERPKLTLGEQHEELLQSIAQKEAQCLELRTQLAMHEEELAQLKRKWERIVNRGVERENSISNANTAALMSTGPTLTFGIEGLKGGFQEASRLLAAGLSTGGGSSRPSSAAPSPLLSSSKPLPRHSAKDSNSSSSTSRTTATSAHRLSQCSSATSYDGDDALKQEVRSTKTDSTHSSPQELIITDTGATPTVSPNPAFLEQKERRRRKRQKDVEGDGWDVWGEEGASDAGLSSNGVVRLQDPPKKSDGKKSQVASPVSSIPGSSIVGLGSLTSPQAWMDTVGKKFGELQKSSTVTALTKSQKRASLMLSDMSQTIALALSDSAPSRPLTRTHSTSSVASHKLSLNSGAVKPSKASPSLLDDDDDVFGSMVSATSSSSAVDARRISLIVPLAPDMTVMTPDVRTTSPVTSSTSKLERRRSVKRGDDSDWNW